MTIDCPFLIFLSLKQGSSSRSTKDHDQNGFFGIRFVLLVLFTGREMRRAGGPGKPGRPGQPDGAGGAAAAAGRQSTGLISGRTKQRQGRKRSLLALLMFLFFLRGSQQGLHNEPGKAKRNAVSVKEEVFFVKDKVSQTTNAYRYFLESNTQSKKSF